MLGVDVRLSCALGAAAAALDDSGAAGTAAVGLRSRTMASRAIRAARREGEHDVHVCIPAREGTRIRQGSVPSWLWDLGLGVVFGSRVARHTWRKATPHSCIPWASLCEGCIPREGRLTSAMLA